MLGQVPDNLIQSNARNETEIQRPGNWKMSLRLDLMASNVNIDFLYAKMKSQSVLAKAISTQPQNSRVEIFAGFDIDGGQNNVVEVIDHDVSLEGSKKQLCVTVLSTQHV